LFSIWVKASRRDAILKALGKYGIGVAVNYRAIHLLKFFSERFKFPKGRFPHSEQIGNSTISLPFYPELASVEFEYVIRILNNIIN